MRRFLETTNKQGIRKAFGQNVTYQAVKAAYKQLEADMRVLHFSPEEIWVNSLVIFDGMLRDADEIGSMTQSMWNDTFCELRDEADDTGRAYETAELQQATSCILYVVLCYMTASDDYGMIRHTESLARQISEHTSLASLGRPFLANVGDGFCQYVKDYISSRHSAMLSQDIERLLKAKPARGAGASRRKSRETVCHTLPYNCRDRATRVRRVNIVMRKMQEWGWIEEPRYAEDFHSLFGGEPRNCNINWTGRPSAILTELMKRLLKQPYMDKVTGLSASSIVKNQFGVSRSSNTKRLDAEAQERIGMVVRILDCSKPLPSLPRGTRADGEDISDQALQAVLAGELHTTRDLRPRC